METNSNVPAGSNTNKVVEIDLIELARKIWIKRVFIAKVTAVLFVFGVLIAFLSPKEYTSSIVVVPQTGEANSKLGGLSGLASMAGINLSDMSGSQTLSPTVYPQILGSITYQKELLQTQVKFEDIDHPISLFDAYTNEKYKKTNVLGVIKKYTIGLPGLILKSLRKKESNVSSDSCKYITLSEDEKRAIEMLSNKVSITLNDKDGYITIAANASEPLVATQITIAAQKLLQKYITAIKIEKAKQTLDFVQDRYSEAKRDYEAAQIRLASYQDFNRNVISAVSKAQSDKLLNDYNLAFSVYNELANQLEQSKIEVKDATPVLSVIQPAYIPIERSKPKRVLIVFALTFLGAFFSSFIVAVQSFLLKIRQKNCNEK